MRSRICLARGDHAGMAGASTRTNRGAKFPIADTQSLLYFALRTLSFRQSTSAIPRRSTKMARRRWVPFLAWVATASLSLPLVSPQVVLAGDETTANTPEPSPKLSWADRIRQAKVRKGEPIVLIVHSAKDCVYCQRWKGSLGGKGDFESWAKTHPDVHLFIVEREAIAVPETIDSYPPVVQWLFERRQRLGNLSPGTPTFEIFVRRNIIWKSYGLHSWDRDAFPALKDLDSRRVPSDVE